MTLPDLQTLWNFNDPAVSEILFRDLLPLAESSGDRGYWAELLTQIARAQGLQRKFKAARQTLAQAEQLLTPELKVAQVRYWLEMGRVRNSSQTKERGRKFFEQAWQGAVALQEDFYAIDALHMIAIVSPPEEQLGWNLKALELAETTTNPRARQWLGSLTNNIGWTYYDLGDYSQALALFEKAVQFRQEGGDSKLIRIAKWCVARTLRALGRTAEALSQQQALEAEEEATGQPDGYVYEEMGECYLALNQPEQARPYFGKAYTLLVQDAWLVQREPDRVQRLYQLWQSA